MLFDSHLLLFDSHPRASPWSSYAARELQRLQLKRYGGAHVAWYFAVPLTPGEYRKQYFSGSPSWICYHKSKPKYCRETFSIDALDHPCRCSKNGKIHDHHVVRDAGNVCLRSMGDHIPRQEQWIPEWKNSSRIEARIDLTITDFGNKKPAHDDYTIRSIDVIQLRHRERTATASIRRPHPLLEWLAQAHA